MEITTDEIMTVCISRQIEDGEIVAQGLSTPLIAAAYLLARSTHAPHLYFMSAIGQGVCRSPAPLRLTDVESLWIDRSLINVGFVRAAAEMLPRFRPIEFFRPAQMDRFGNFNNVAFGKDYAKPRLRLPGTGGIADLTTFISNIYLYVPRHSRITFVEKIDFLSGLGHNPIRKDGQGPQYLVTDLGQFDFNGDSKPEKGHLRLTSIHPGVTVSRIKARTGFDFDILPNLQVTSQPTEEEIRLLREEIDPYGIRRLEILSGAARRQLISEIIQNELHGSNHIH
jgi:acyl CoA:acetate/3-ketoacid CoA transferase beta subunit